MKPTTPRRRQIAMGVLLGLAVVGACVRSLAPNPSLWRDIGTLMLVLWLPAVGNLIAFVVRKLPRRAPGGGVLADDAPFVAHLSAQLTPLPQATAAAQQLDASRLCVVLAGSHAYSARLAQPVRDWLLAGEARTLALQFLRPQVALKDLVPGTAFHLVLGATAVGHGQVDPIDMQPAQGGR